MPPHFLVTFLSILIPLAHILGAICAIHATLFTRTSQGAIAWALSLFFFPYITVPCYLVLGRQKFHGYVEARRRGDRDIDALARKIGDEIAPCHTTLPAGSERFSVFEHLASLPFTCGNSARLLIDGDATFDAIFQAIDHAQHYILVQFFIVRDDDLGRKLRDKLLAKAQAGVKVFFLYDEIGSFRLRESYFAPLRQAGAKIYPFHTQRGLWNRFQINFRNHRKIVITDGAAAYLGGLNVGDEYLGKSKAFGHWRDTHVELRGSAVAAVQLSFLQDWHWATGEILELGPLPAAPSNPTSACAIVIPSSPADTINTCTLMFLAAISSAQKRLWLTSPYFVPDETVFDALQLAALRGVDVRILLPNMPDHYLVYLSAFSYLQTAEKAPIHFYRYHAGFLHQKVMLIDDQLASVGTANLDNRSMRLNFEITLFLADKLFAAAVEKMLIADFAQATLVTSDELLHHTLPFRLAVRIARLFSPIL